jgi:PKD repeat protein
VTAGGTAQADFQTALNTAAGTAPADRIELGATSFSRAGGFSYGSVSPVQIVGIGNPFNWALGTTRLANATVDPTSEDVLRVSGSAASSVSNLAVLLPYGANGGNTGLKLSDGTANRIHVQGDVGAAVSSTGVELENATISNSVVDVEASFGAGIDFASGSNNQVVDTQVTGNVAAIRLTEGTGGRADRSDLSSDGSGVSLAPGTTMVVDASTMHSPGRTTFLPNAGISFQNLAGANSSIDVINTTIVGSNFNFSPSSGILMANGSNRIMSVTMRNSVMIGFTNSVTRTATAPAASNFTSINSAYAPFTDSANGTRSETGRLDITDLGLLQDDHLPPTSPLVDAGDNAGVAATDRDGQPRIVDGNSDCSARVDIGAFELQSAPRAPKVVATKNATRIPVGQAVSFTADGSCDPDGDALTYAWNFGDDTSATGATAQHEFTTPGRSNVELVATDATGRSTSATTGVITILPRFAGATVRTKAVASSKLGIVKVVVACPSTAFGTCTGKLALAPVQPRRGRRLPALGAKAFSAPVGGSTTVAVKLTKAGFALFTTRASLATVATVTSTDTSGVNATTKRTITLRRPPAPVKKPTR